MGMTISSEKESGEYSSSSTLMSSCFNKIEFLKGLSPEPLTLKHLVSLIRLVLFTTSTIVNISCKPPSFNFLVNLLLPSILPKSRVSHNFLSLKIVDFDADGYDIANIARDILDRYIAT